MENQIYIKIIKNRIFLSLSKVIEVFFFFSFYNNDATISGTGARVLWRHRTSMSLSTNAFITFNNIRLICTEFAINIY